MADVVVVGAAVAGVVIAAAAAGLEADLGTGFVESGAVLADGVWAKARPAAANRIVSDFRVVVRIFIERDSGEAGRAASSLRKRSGDTCARKDAGRPPQGPGDP